MKSPSKLGALSCCLAATLVSAVFQDPVSAQTTGGPLGRQWRDVLYQIPGPDWHLLPDPDPVQASHRVVLTRREALHEIELVLTSAEAPAALAPSEVAGKYFDERKRQSLSGGAFSDVKVGQRTIGGTIYPSFSERFTPTAGPPIVDEQEVLVFPADYGQRQRYLIVQWSDSHSGTTGTTTLDDLDRFISSLSLAPLGSVLLTDDFSDPLNGPMSDNGSSEHYDVSYKDGQFTIQKNTPEFDGAYVARAPGFYADSTLAVDTHMTASGYGPLAYLWCRRSSAGSYRVAIDPSDGSAILSRLTGDSTIVELAPWTTSPAIKTGTASNHLEMICRGSLVELDANGTPVFAVHNTELSDGAVAIGGGGFTDYDVAPEIRFANLVVIQS